MINKLQGPTSRKTKPNLGRTRTRRVRAAKAASKPESKSHLLDLIKLRIGQIHECKHCVQKQTKKLLKEGETEVRLLHLDKWRGSSLFNEQEEAALNLVEVLSENIAGNIPAKVLQTTHQFFGHDESTCQDIFLLAGLQHR